MSKYDNIIKLPHYEPKHPRMSIDARSAQFAPFSALTGYSDAVNETARQTDRQINITDDVKNILDMKLQIIEEHIKEQPEITIVYFIEDEKKSGGKYVKYTGNVKRIDNIEQVIIFNDKFKVNFNAVLEINADFINI